MCWICSNQATRYFLTRSKILSKKKSKKIRRLHSTEISSSWIWRGKTNHTHLVYLQLSQVGSAKKIPESSRKQTKSPKDKTTIQQHKVSLTVLSTQQTSSSKKMELPLSSTLRFQVKTSCLFWTRKNSPTSLWWSKENPSTVIRLFLLLDQCILRHSLATTSVKKTRELQPTMTCLTNSSLCSWSTSTATT